MKTIYRYEINNSNGINEVMMPNGAEVISVGVSTETDKEVISVWAIVDTDETFVKRYFTVIGTGANLDEFGYMQSKFIGTVKKKNQYAFHVFEYFKY